MTCVLAVSQLSVSRAFDRDMMVPFMCLASCGDIFPFASDASEGTAAATAARAVMAAPMEKKRIFRVVLNRGGKFRGAIARKLGEE